MSNDNQGYPLTRSKPQRLGWPEHTVIIFGLNRSHDLIVSPARHRLPVSTANHHNRGNTDCAWNRLESMKWLTPVAVVVVLAAALAALAALATLTERVDKLEEDQKPKLRLLALR
jgi:hypothetical protein